MINMNVKDNVPVFHQEIFETPSSDLPLENRTLQSIRQQRGQRLTKEKVSDLVSPGSFDLNTNENQVSGSNTRFLFKNLYGETLLTFLFFSKHNIENIQNVVKFIVYREMGYVIDNQSTTELLIIMRAIFLEYSFHPKLITENMSQEERQSLLKKYTQEVYRLNTILINQIVPKIVSQIQQYVDYLRDASQQPYQMNTPKNDSVQGQKEYRSTTQVFLGGDF
jgi:hypothetical protein